MAKDLIIGGASGYDWSQLKYWVKSIRETGFDGDVVLVATNITNETIDKLLKYGVKVAAYGNKMEIGFFKDLNKFAPHVERFHYIHEYLVNSTEEYRYVIMTDTRDVIFQKNPVLFLEKNLQIKSMVCSSEGMLYKDEPWGSRNLLETFGQHFYERYKEWPIFNVGTIAGYTEEMRDFINVLFQLSYNRTIPIVDQAVFNYMINMAPYSDHMLKTSNVSGWAIQLACTRAAVEAGSGDIGAVGDLAKYDQVYQDIQPKVRADGVTVTTPYDITYCIVHQWDRIPSLKTEIERKYADND
jgi:hypothetical protein